MNFEEFKAQFQPFTIYKVKLHIFSIAGGIPKNKDLVGSFIDATNKEKSKEERQELVDATIADLPNVSVKVEDKSTTVFKSDENGLFIEDRQIKAMIKENANILRTLLDIQAARSKVADQLFVMEQKIYLGRMKADEEDQRPVHAKTPQGPISALKKSEICKDVDIEFHVKILSTCEIKETDLWSILLYGQDNAVGSDRSQGRGLFDVTSVEIVDKANLSLFPKKVKKSKKDPEVEVVEEGAAA